MKLPSKIRFADEKVLQAFEELKTQKEFEWLYQSLNQSLSEIEENAFGGIQIPKKQIPKKYFKKYSIDNCWKKNLPKGWRVVYSITKDEVIVISIILEWFNHKDYNEEFGYD